MHYSSAILGRYVLFLSFPRYSSEKPLKLTFGESVAMCFLAMVNIGTQVMPIRLASR